MNPSFQTVHIVQDYQDAPLTGYADFDGVPHLYRRLFSSENDEYTDYFSLRRVNEPVLRTALALWELWSRWNSSFAAGSTTLSTHPALPTDRSEYARLSQELEQKLAALPQDVLYAIGHFRRDPSNSVQWQVSWEAIAAHHLPRGTVMPAD